jgi:methionyl-tRNA formyltransferase
MVVGPGLRVVFFGTPAFAVPTLDAILASRHRLAAVVTQPDRPRGRGQRTIDAPVKARAVAAGLPVLQPETLKDAAFQSALQAFEADVGVVAAYGKILPDAVLAMPRHGMINVHASLLPRYRGAAPVHRAVIAGDTVTGVTIMRIVKALDAGPMLDTITVPIPAEATSVDVERELAAAGAPLLVGVLNRLAAGPVPGIPQDDSVATYAARLTRDEGRIDWTVSAPSVHNLIRGLHPWPHAYTYLGARRLILLRSRVRPEPPAAPPGTVVLARGDALHVATGDGTLDVQELQAEGARAMTTRDFLAGHRIGVGDRFAGAP